MSNTWVLVYATCVVAAGRCVRRSPRRWGFRTSARGPVIQAGNPDDQGVGRAVQLHSRGDGRVGIVVGTQLDREPTSPASGRQTDLRRMLEEAADSQSLLHPNLAI